MFQVTWLLFQSSYAKILLWHWLHWIFNLKQFGFQIGEQTTLLHNEEESFALAPVDASALRGHIRTKRKRKLIVDEVKAIAGEEMKAQLSDTTDIVTTLDLAPPTKRLMHWKETGGVEKLFALPGRPLHARNLFKAYQDHLTSQPTEDEYFGLLGETEKENLILDHVPGEEFGQPDPRTPAKRGRKRKNPLPEDEDSTPATPAVTGSRRSNRLQAPNATPLRDLQADLDEQQQVFSPRKERAESQHQQELSSPASVAAPAASQHFENMGYDAEDPHMANLGWEESAASMAGAPTPGDDLGPMSMGAPSVGPPSMGAPTPYREDEDEDEEEDEYNVTNTSADVSRTDGQVHPEEDEEMLEGETVEEFEDRVLNKRAAHLNTILKSKLAVLPELRLSQMTKRNSRKQAAQKFYSLLVLQKALAVNIFQPENNGDISVTKGPRFETAVI